MKQTFIVLIAAGAMLSSASCSKLQHCECRVFVTIQGTSQDTILNINSQNFKDTHKNGEEYCSGEFNDQLQAMYPSGTIDCRVEANE
jgi:hypothetical protein